MKTNRQKMHNVSFKQCISAKKNKKEPAVEKVTLASLLMQNLHGQHAKLVCKQQIAVIVQNIHGTLSKSKKQNKNVYLRGGTRNALRQCLANWQVNQTKKYLFAPLNPPQSVRSFRTSQCDLGKHISLTKNTSEAPFKFSIQKQASLQKYQSAPALQQESVNSKRLFSQKGIKEKQSEKKMFVVEEVGQSMQSESRSSFKSNYNKENMNLPNLTSIMPRLSSKDIKNQQEMLKEQLVFQEPIQVEDKMQKTKQQSPWSLQKQKQPESPQLQHKQSIQEVKESQGQSRFSFTTQMRHGLLSNNHQSIEPEQSFKIAGDEQIETQKKRLKEQSMGSQLCSMSQLSSITSNLRDEPFKKQAEQNSLKHDLEDINKYCQRKSVQKLNLHTLAHQRQQRFDDRIQITSKTQNKSEYTVKYDLRFVKRTSPQPTEVVRLSPLRFRKKPEEDLGAIVHANTGTETKRVSNC